MNDQLTTTVAELGRALVGPGFLGPPKREADFDHRDIYRNDVGLAREIARSDPFGVNAVRTKRASVIGQGLKLDLRPDFKALGVTVEQANEWALAYMSEFSSWTNSPHFECDAQRKQTFTGLLWTIYDSFYVAGEVAAVLKFKKGFGPYETCIQLIEPERISTPNDKIASSNIRHGIEMEDDGTPIAYHIAQKSAMPFSMYAGPVGVPRWDRVPRYTPWGRPIVLHAFSHIRPDMTRGISTFASVIKNMRMLREYSQAELQSAIVQAAYAAVIKTDLDFDDAMKVVGALNPAVLGKYNNNPFTASIMEYMRVLAPFYGEMGLRYQGGKIPHLAPNDTLDVLKSTHPNSVFDKFEGAMLRQLCAGLGVDYPALSKNYAEVNYSGARAALADVWRAYMLERVFISTHVAMPIVMAHMEECILKGRIPLLGKMAWLEARYYLVRGQFVGWGKPMIDPDKERKAQRLGLDMGIETRQDMAAEEGNDFGDIVNKRAQEEKALTDAGLTPEVLMPELQAKMQQNADVPKTAEMKG